MTEYYKIDTLFERDEKTFVMDLTRLAWHKTNLKNYRTAYKAKLAEWQRVQQRVQSGLRRMEREIWRRVNQIARAEMEGKSDV